MRGRTLEFSRKVFREAVFVLTSKRTGSPFLKPQLSSSSGLQIGRTVEALKVLA